MVNRLIILFAAAALAACAGHSTPQVLPNAQREILSNSSPLAGITASFEIAVPPSALAAKSVSIVPNTGTPVIHSIGPTATGCMAAGGGHPLRCMVPVPAKSGTNTFFVKTFSGSNATGSVLAQANILQTFTANSTIPVTLAGTPTGISLTLSNAAPFECGPPATIAVFVSVKDASGEIIVTNNYGTAVTLHDADTSGATTVSPSAITSSAKSVTLAYNGHLLKSAVISASATGVSPANVHDATLMPSQMLYAVDGDAATFDVFSLKATGNVAPARRIKMGIGGGELQDALATNCVVFVADGSVTQNAIFSFNARANGAVAPLTKLSGSNTLLNGPNGVGVNPLTGMVYAPIQQGAMPGIGIWASTASGNVAPSSRIIGTKTTISNPSAIAFDATGRLYVLAFRSILVFAKGATGNVAPAQSLNTGFFCPDAVAVDSTNHIYVADHCNGQIKVWAPNATGNATPLRTIQVDTSHGGGADGLALSYSNTLFTANAFVPFVASYSPAANGSATPLTKISGSNTTFLYVPYVAL